MAANESLSRTIFAAHTAVSSAPRWLSTSLAYRSPSLAMHSLGTHKGRTPKQSNLPLNADAGCWRCAESNLSITLNVRFGSFSTDLASLAWRLLSASLRKRT
jgi:hypothetical protein